jgi:heterotetrameric sarcosine oxidase delta subunit
MRIRCPWCGERGLEEFTYRGDATVRRPASLDTSAEQAWVDYVYLRDNPAGRHREYWYHGAGCHAWLVVTRDTRTHEILSVELAAGDAA